MIQANFNLSYFNHSKSFDLQSLLATGKYYIDEYGLLITPNGTRYRIPSGPPEGRKPLRLDKVLHTSNMPLLNTFNQSYETIHIELQDTNKLISNHDIKSNNHSIIQPVQLSYIESTKLLNAKTHTLNHTLSSSSSLSSTPSSSLNTILSSSLHYNSLHTIDWNVILLTLIISSIS
ncbi:hypothetical protein MN116_008753 [Schistosoma mekongi]|uniref:Uncharacterized protein n=1 Tax=Schistosoma mekongi TaxID=38744 RepID=A0AAE2D2A6_SCHME|nr:hypothetical protein MN116_008753 [Schistosoma mekongi]